MGPVPFDKLRRLGDGEKKASPGMFRVVTWIDDVPHQVGDDWPSLHDAVKSALKQACQVQVFDDRGDPRISERGPS